MTTFLWISAAVLILIGLAGLIIPVIPGIPLMFAGFILGAWAGGFEHVGFTTLVILGLLAGISVAVDTIAVGLGAKKVGASRKAIAGAMIGSVVGLFAGIPGIIIMPFFGAVIGQYMSRADWNEAGKAGFGTWLGMLVGIAVKIGLAFAMIGVFITAYLV